MSKEPNHLTCSWCGSHWMRSSFTPIKPNPNFVCPSCTRAADRAIGHFEAFAAGLESRDARGASFVREAATTVRDVLNIAKETT